MMKKIQPKNVEDSEEDNTASVPKGHSNIDDFLKRSMEKQLKDAKNRINSKNAGIENKYKSLPASLHTTSVDESSDEYYFSMMDSFLSERVTGILEEKKKVDPSNMISTDANPSGETPVEVSGCQGMNPSEYAKAQGIAGFKTESESNPDHGLSFVPHTDHTNYQKKRKSGIVMPRDPHHAGVVFDRNGNKVANVRYHPPGSIFGGKEGMYRIGSSKHGGGGKSIEEAMSKYKGPTT